MTNVLLFCTSEEAKQVTRKALNMKEGDRVNICSTFYLVESRTCPKNREDFRQEIQDNNTFESEFIGASAQDCQKWALNNQYRVNFVEHDIITMADSCNATDNTLSIQFYSRLDPPLEFEGFGALPREVKTWHDFRVDYKDARTVYTSLYFGPFGAVYPAYFGRKEEFTDEHGIFDVAKAERALLSHGPDTVQD
ncbi:hypothetical protein BGW36DRAFT_356445 [Talaromyces proteolyticus]|uniref:Uncharacterized protein n=1 Tax=Talaromyces proteolyticus TaxID=1131652 RepID=A0AAD4Q1I7_9EURO|nr:uncharacterized protein BGW36DRAFT_356445 [Talaromyces proteolyticus]KAH8702319.1 hypothetical protein BGW36DRAFT_356445 [Talaromyces proteolyticus]